MQCVKGQFITLYQENLKHEIWGGSTLLKAKGNASSLLISNLLFYKHKIICPSFNEQRKHFIIPISHPFLKVSSLFLADFKKLWLLEPPRISITLVGFRVYNNSSNERPTDNMKESANKIVTGVYISVGPN